MIIQNTEQLATSQLRKDGVAIIEVAFSAVIPKKAIEKKVRRDENILIINGTAYDLEQYKNLYVVGFGKSLSEMARALEDILEDKITRGVVISTKEVKFKKIEYYPGIHPFPSRQNIDATKKLVEVVKNAGKED